MWKGTPALELDSGQLLMLTEARRTAQSGDGGRGQWEYHGQFKIVEDVFISNPVLKIGMWN